MVSILGVIPWIAIWYDTEKIGIVLGKTVGDVLELDMRENRVAWGKFLRVRVLLNVTKPLKRCCKLSKPNGGTLLVMIRYERLSDFCFVCGRLDHHESKCDIAFQLKKRDGKVKREYGQWLGANYKMGTTRTDYQKMVIGDDYDNERTGLKSGYGGLAERLRAKPNKLKQLCDAPSCYIETQQTASPYQFLATDCDTYATALTRGAGPPLCATSAMMT
ncbi:hypothetical protein REPUB_Repub19eG0048900 [Reevesia pubescens]